MDTLTISKPDDMHLHLRDGAELASIVKDTARRFARAVVMPNLWPPVINVVQAIAYRERILNRLDDMGAFEPLMTLYLTDSTGPDEIRRAAQSEYVYGVKLYPAGATTNSESGVTDIENVYAVIEALAEHQMPLLVHGEVTDADVDVFDREAVFIERVLEPILDRFKGIRVVFEHVSTRRAVEFVRGGPDNLAATITAHHLLYNRSQMFRHGIRPHYYCLPLLKSEDDRQALIEAATSAHPRFFLGTDSAPHARSAKETACGCAGIYSAHGAIELYAQVFEAAGALDRLETFACGNGAAFYRLPRNRDSITLQRREWQIPDSLPFGDNTVVPLGAGERCHWTLKVR
ncbi:MAG: dihydroorotase [Gammaproteobacteria bacterium]|nr:dihydroorotase [Gammaproteobacteria bacterium]